MYVCVCLKRVEQYIRCIAARAPPHPMVSHPPALWLSVVHCGVGSPLPLPLWLRSAAPPSMAIAGWASDC